MQNTPYRESRESRAYRIPRKVYSRKFIYSLRKGAVLI